MKHYRAILHNGPYKVSVTDIAGNDFDSLEHTLIQPLQVPPVIPRVVVRQRNNVSASLNCRLSKVATDESTRSGNQNVVSCANHFFLCYNRHSWQGASAQSNSCSSLRRNRYHSAPATRTMQGVTI